MDARRARREVGAINDLKALLKRSGLKCGTSKTSKRMGKPLSPASSAGGQKESSPNLHNQNGDFHQQYPHLKVEVEVAEPKYLLERLCRIGEEVDEFLRASKDVKEWQSLKPLQSTRENGAPAVNDMQYAHQHYEGDMYSASNKPSIDEKSNGIQPGSNAEGTRDLDGPSQNGEFATHCQEPLESTPKPGIGFPSEDDNEEAESESESESDDDDGLKQLWFEMDLYRESMQGRGEKAERERECNHDFILEGDVGLVCTHCGLVGQDIEAIFNFTFGNEPKKRQNHKPEAPDLIKNLGESEDNPADSLDPQANQKIHKSLELHPQHKEEMHPHQIAGFKFLEQNVAEGTEPGGCILAHAPGSGKTFLIIAFLHSFLQKYPQERVLIMAPTGVLLSWANEFKKWNFDIPLLNLYDSSNLWQYGAGCIDDDVATQDASVGSHKLQRLKEWQIQKSVLFISYGHFSLLVNPKKETDDTAEIKRLLFQVPGLLILDEGHTSRNTDTVILNSLTHVRTKRRILLSGTLFQNNFEELYNLFKLVRPDFMSSRAESLRAFMKPIMEAPFSKENRMQAKLFKFKASSKKQRAEVMEQRIFVDCMGGQILNGSANEQMEALNLLHELMEPFVHWHKGQILKGLPGLTDFTVFLGLTPAQKAVFAAMHSQALRTMEKEKRSALVNFHPSLLKPRLNTKQASPHKVESPSQEDNVESPANVVEEEKCPPTHCEPVDGSKAKFVLDMVALCSQLHEKVLIFSQYLPPLTLLQRFFHKCWGWQENHQMLRLDGDTSPDSREHIMRKFNKGKGSHVLLASIRACGEGVSLVGASRVIFLDVNWNPAVTQQAISRAFRIGQTKRVFAYRLVGAGTMDEEIEKTAAKKEWLGMVISRANTTANFETSLEEVDPQVEDELFESINLRKLVTKCYRRVHFSCCRA